MLPPSSQPSNKILCLISSIDEFKGEWRAVETIKSERLQSFRRVRLLMGMAPDGAIFMSS